MPFSRFICKAFVPIMNKKKEGPVMTPNPDDNTQEELDDYANQNNPNNDAYQADLDNHANQCNPNNDEYRGH